MTRGIRQEILFLWLSNSALDSHILGWSHYHGRDLDHRMTEINYRTGTDALGDGWRLMTASAVPSLQPGAELRASHLRHEFMFERLDRCICQSTTGNESS